MVAATRTALSQSLCRVLDPDRCDFTSAYIALMFFKG